MKHILRVVALVLVFMTVGCSGSSEPAAKTNEEVQAFSGDPSKMPPGLAEKMKDASKPPANFQQVK